MKERIFNFISNIYFIVSLIVVTSVLLYIFYKPIGVNTNFKDYWENFNSLIFPILTAINIFVFIRLTNKIDQNNKKKHEKEIDMQVKFRLFNIRNENIKIFKDNILKLREELADGQNIHSQLINVNRVLISNIEGSIFFTSEGLQQLIETTKIYELIDKIDKIIKNGDPLQDEIKEELFKQTFILIDILESFSLVQLKSDDPDPVYVYLHEINDKITQFYNADNK